jgi:transketolase C-terminal domain/subunit
MNQYRHRQQINYVQDEPGKPAIVLTCQEGFPQGYKCSSSMFCYEMGLMILMKKLEVVVPCNKSVKQVFA